MTLQSCCVLLQLLSPFSELQLDFCLYSLPSAKEQLPASSPTHVLASKTTTLTLGQVASSHMPQSGHKESTNQ